MTPAAWTVDVPEATLSRIAAQLEVDHVGHELTGQPTGWQHGTDAAYLAELVDYWRRDYDWHAAERTLNRWPQFTVDIDGQRVHFLHARSASRRAFPLLLTHGWPGSAYEFLGAIEPLLDRGYDVIVPSLPGFGFSGPAPAGFTSPREIARLWRRLMVDVLGHARFGAQGGDFGARVTAWLGEDHADAVAAIHLNLFDAPAPSDLDDEQTRQWRRERDATLQREGAYAAAHWTKPQTIGLALAASPIAFASWILEKLHGWADNDGRIEARFTKDELITAVMIYLVGGTVQSSIWLYRSFLTEQAPDTVAAPAGLALYPGEFTPYPPRSAAERKFDIRRWTEQPTGGHFAAWEEPALFAADVADFFDEVQRAEPTERNDR